MIWMGIYAAAKRNMHETGQDGEEVDGLLELSRAELEAEKAGSKEGDIHLSA